ncbi:MAG: hypothetical protein JW820_12230 [Spirochaetales bacterium]|nr:hypothetical protein [Spirochaetales bacterium]
MAKRVNSYKETFADALSTDKGVEALERAFLAALPEGVDGKQLFADALQRFAPEELPEVCAELATTLTASASEDDFHNWNYDHLEFIIDLSNRYGLLLPRNLINGLPEQLILLVDEDKLIDPEAD